MYTPTTISSTNLMLNLMPNFIRILIMIILFLLWIIIWVLMGFLWVLVLFVHLLLIVIFGIFGVLRVFVIVGVFWLFFCFWGFLFSFLFLFSWWALFLFYFWDHISIILNLLLLNNQYPPQLLNNFLPTLNLILASQPNINNSHLILIHPPTKISTYKLHKWHITLFLITIRYKYSRKEITDYGAVLALGWYDDYVWGCWVGVWGYCMGEIWFWFAWRWGVRVLVVFVGVVALALVFTLFLLVELFWFVADFINFRPMISKTLFKHLTKIHIKLHNLLTNKSPRPQQIHNHSILKLTPIP